MASKEEMESRIREQRTAEANKKGLVGQGGKIGTVLRALGSPIVGQTEDVDSIVENLCSPSEASVVAAPEKTPMKKAVERNLLAKSDKTYYIFGGIIAAQVLALVYVLFFM